MACASLAQAYISQQEQLADPALEAKAMAIGRQLRCMTCSGQTINDSAAPLAVDMRRQVRQMLREGRTQQDILTWFRGRYGDDILQKPPLGKRTALLWLLPLLMLAAGGVIVWRMSFSKAT